ncbi:Blue copper oxidase CueO precursor [compost metagenome]
MVELDLTAGTARINVDGKTVEVLAYNGAYPGPTLELHEGDRLVVRFKNALSEPTSLHWHGLHIPADQDDATHLVQPGASREFAFDIPMGSAGTYWYHPHLHGSVASQVARGLFGAIRVKAADDPLPAAAGDTLAVLSDLRVGANGVAQAGSNAERANGFEGELVLVNGKRQPALELRPGETRRLRLLNASASRYYRLSAGSQPMTLVGTDGGLIDKPVSINDLLLTPGERAEVLVTAPNQAGASFSLLALPYDRGIMAMSPKTEDGQKNPVHGGHVWDASLDNPTPTPSSTPMNHSNMATEHGGIAHGAMTPSPMASSPTGTTANQSALDASLLTFHVSGEPAPAVAIPPSLRSIARLEGATATRELLFSEDHATMDFRINNLKFDMNRVDLQAKLGTTETWSVKNTGHMDHPFHLHGYAFQVLDRNGTPEPYLAWKDTVNVKPNETVRFNVKYNDFPGLRVFHCHILDHEDLGMMGVFRVDP